ncbi:MAG TPA: methionine biosynthesis protein MetW [Firmicutes bacterium]|nr:methionine biosynthesis protein MetW [Bacillota bacterium]
MSIRWDHQAIYEIIPAGSSVLDLGCGDGELLSKLIRYKGVQGQGIEKDIDHVMECVARGVPVYHADLDQGLAGFPDGFFDYVVLEKTLQAVHKPLLVLEEMLRVGRAGIVSFPNFGHWGIIASFVRTGRMPITPVLPYQWHDTPNIHLFTVSDFLDWAKAKGVMVERGLSWVDGKVQPFGEGHALLAEEVLFVVSRIPHEDTCDLTSHPASFSNDLIRA